MKRLAVAAVVMFAMMAVANQANADHRHGRYPLDARARVKYHRQDRLRHYDYGRVHHRHYRPPVCRTPQYGYGYSRYEYRSYPRYGYSRSHLHYRSPNVYFGLRF